MIHDDSRIFRSAALAEQHFVLICPVWSSQPWQKAAPGKPCNETWMQITWGLKKKLGGPKVDCLAHQQSSNRLNLSRTGNKRNFQWTYPLQMSTPLLTSFRDTSSPLFRRFFLRSALRVALHGNCLHSAQTRICCKMHQALQIKRATL